MDEFNADYYSTLAQVIPTLFIAAIATRYFSDRNRDDSFFMSVLLLAVVMVVVFGEGFVLDALKHRETPEGATDSIITFATLAPLFMIAAELFRAPGLRVLSQMNERQFGWVQKAIGPVTTLVLIAAFALVIIEPEAFNQVMAWILVGFLGVVAVVYLVHTRPKGRDDAPDESEQ